MKNIDAVDSLIPNEAEDLNSAVGEGNDKIRDVKIVDEMQKAYLDYAMSVIVARALPDARDGLKPVQRRIIYAALEIGALPSSKHQKCAKIVGEVLAKYHPHDNVSVYDAMVRMAQPFSLRYPLINGQGNFGSIDGDSAAAMRYTEAKLSKISLELMQNINEETVVFMDNYSAEYREPILLPSVVPNLLLNGAQGIAVGMATSMPPHNLNEVVDATITLIKSYKPDIENKILLPQARVPFEDKDAYLVREQIMEERQIPVFDGEATIEQLVQHVQGPDFPTAGIIYDKTELLQMYATGKGRVVTRARTNIEELKNGKFAIIVTELPYQVNKARLVSKIADLVRDKKVEGITDLRDESDRTGIRVVIETKQGARPQKILNKLYKHTELQSNFNSNFVALVNNEPRVMNLKMILEEFVRHRQNIIIRRSEYNLAKLQEREHILLGYKIALDNIEEVIKTIRASQDTEEAKTSLMAKFGFSEMQAVAILDMQLRRLAQLEREKIEEELKEVLRKTGELKAILASPEKILSIITDELTEIKKNYGDERKTEIVAGKVGILNEEDLVAKEEAIISLTKTGYIKRLQPSTYKKQTRGGKGVLGMSTKEADQIKSVTYVTTHDEMLFFTNLGRAYKKRAWDVPESSRQSKGTNVINLLDLKSNETVTEFCSYDPETKSEIKYVLFTTKKGSVKRTPLEDFQNVRQNGIIAIGLKEGDTLASTDFTGGNQNILITTRQGKSIRFNESDVRVMGRSAGGVRGIKLGKDDEVISVQTFKPEDEENLYTLTVSEKGYGKKTRLTEYSKITRGGKGVKTTNITPKTGNLTDSLIVSNQGDLLLTSAEGVVIRISIKKVPILSRSTQGVILMKFKGKTDYLSTVTYLDE
ncbi:DNA gyrase subunit A [bacterium]|nr:DNA gyrase subunit A [bacterium]